MVLRVCPRLGCIVFLLPLHFPPPPINHLDRLQFEFLGLYYMPLPHLRILLGEPESC